MNERESKGLKLTVQELPFDPPDLWIPELRVGVIGIKNQFLRRAKLLQAATLKAQGIIDANQSDTRLTEGDPRIELLPTAMFFMENLEQVSRSLRAGHELLIEKDIIE